MTAYAQPVRRLLLPGFLLLLLCSCASKEIAQLNESVSSLETRLQRYQQETNRDTAQTTSSLGQVNQSISNAFKDIRYAQSNMENMLEQISTRLSKVEQQVIQLQERTDRMDKQTADSYNQLTGHVNQVQTETQQSLREEIKKLSDSLAVLKSESQSNYAKAMSAVGDTQSRLDKRISGIEAGNREIYSKILKELGVSTPKETPAAKPKQAAEKEESYNGTVHIVEKGDTLAKIATKYKVSMKAIRELNGMAANSGVRIGQRLKIPKP